MTLSKSYNSNEIENKWSKEWKNKKIFSFKPGKKNFVIDHPPAFTSGTLHMGHILDYSWIDFAARIKRMRGFNVLLPIGYDCHGLPTELKVAETYGIKKDNREEFLKKCMEFTDECINKMNEQYERMGYSCDWSSLYRTMDDDYKRLVQSSLLTMYNNGLIYREKHPIPWCTKCKTALAKAEMGYINKSGKLHYFKIKVDGAELQIATTRPEMLPACVGVFVHPDDKRYKKFIGKEAVLPVTGKKVPILSDKDVDMEFGSGVVYLCTYGDEQDIAWKKRYKLPEKIIIDEDGVFTCEPIKGMREKEARAKIIELLKKEDALVKIEDLPHSVLCHTERSSCQNPIEFIPIPQFFIKIRPFTKEIIENGKKIKWYPEFLRAHLTNWSKNMDWDWIISRQRIFGTPIPFWYCNKCGKIFPPKEKDLPVDPSKTKWKGNCECGGKIEGSNDVCDCWVDSSITPLAISKWKSDEKFFKATYPNSIRIQGYEIIRTWLFYTLFRCNKLTGKIPWSETLQHGNVLGENGKKMSKSAGNQVNPDEAFEKYGADALRQWAATATQGDDLGFTTKEIEHGRKFLNKFWNISRFVEMNLSGEPRKKEIKNPIDKWIMSKLNRLINDVNSNLDRYVFNIPLQDIRSFLWHEFADYYIEMVKHRLYGDDKETVLYVLYEVLSKCTRLLAPFTPFITEEIYQNLFKRDVESVHLLDLPKSENKYIDKKIEKLGEMAKDIVSTIRQYKNKNNMPMNAELKEIVIDSKIVGLILDDIKGTVKAKDIRIGKASQMETEIFKVHLDISQ